MKAWIPALLCYAILAHCGFQIYHIDQASQKITRCSKNHQSIDADPDGSSIEIIDRGSHILQTAVQ